MDLHDIRSLQKLWTSNYEGTEYMIILWEYLQWLQKVFVHRCIYYSIYLLIN